MRMILDSIKDVAEREIQIRRYGTSTIVLMDDKIFKAIFTENITRHETNNPNMVRLETVYDGVIYEAYSYEKGVTQTDEFV